MKPYGREKKVTSKNKKDAHPRKGFMNWWEDRCDELSRTTMKQKLKKEILNELKDFRYERTEEDK